MWWQDLQDPCEGRGSTLWTARHRSWPELFYSPAGLAMLRAEIALPSKVLLALFHHPVCLSYLFHHPVCLSLYSGIQAYHADHELAYFSAGVFRSCCFQICCAPGPREWVTILSPSLPLPFNKGSHRHVLSDRPDHSLHLEALTGQNLPKVPKYVHRPQAGRRCCSQKEATA